MNIHTGNHRVQDLTDRLPDVEQIHLNWRMFGSAGKSTLSDKLITERFVRSERMKGRGGRMRGFKTLFRTRSFSRIGIHRPKYPTGENAPSANGSGLKNGEFILGNWRSNDPSELALAQVNHYATRDAASFLLKVKRGRAHQAHNPLDLEYWRRHDLNESKDDRLARRSSDIWAEMRRLDDLSDGRLLLLRRRAMNHWQQELARLLEDEGSKALYDTVIGQPGNQKSPA